MDEIQLRLECIRIASDNLRSSTGQAMDKEVLEYAQKLFGYISGYRSDVHPAA